MGKLDTYPGKSRTVSDQKWFELNAALALIPEMQKRGLSLAKIDEFTGRLLRDGSPRLLVSAVTEFFELDAEGFLSDLEDDPKSAWLLVRDEPEAPKEERFVMPSPDVLAKLPAHTRLVLAERERAQREKDKAKGGGNG